MLMFAKTSLKGFVYNMIDIFMFPQEEAVKTVYENQQVKSCQPKFNRNRQYLDDFLIHCDRGLQVSEKDARKIIFEVVMIVSKIINRLDLSDDFWAQFGVQNKKIKKQVGLHEIESINNPNILTISINPKEYFEKYRDKRINKKHKGLKRNTPGMDFEAYSSRLLFLLEFCD